MHRILIIGASRGIGLEAVRRGLDGGHSIRAMARSADRIGLRHQQLETIAADASDPAAVRAALSGVGAVIHTVGVAPSIQRMLKPIDVFSKTTRVLVSEMKTARTDRLVAITGFGAGDSWAKLSSFESIPYRLFLGTAYDDKDRQEAIIRESGLDWLIVRPTILTNRRRSGRYRVLVEPQSWRNGLISRADVADFLIREAATPQLSRVAPALAY